jgi:hypothetical protein
MLRYFEEPTRKVRHGLGALLEDTMPRIGEDGTIFLDGPRVRLQLQALGELLQRPGTLREGAESPSTLLASSSVSSAHRPQNADQTARPSSAMVRSRLSSASDMRSSICPTLPAHSSRAASILGSTFSLAASSPSSHPGYPLAQHAPTTPTNASASAAMTSGLHATIPR